MNNLLKTLLIASFTLGSYSAFAGNNSTNTEDSQEGLVQDESGVTEQSTGTNTRKSTSNSKKSMAKNHQTRHSMDYKMMDANSDGMISKGEYMTYHEQSYGKMKHTNDNVSIKDMEDYMNLGTTKGNKLQPSNTKDAPPVTTR